MDANLIAMILLGVGFVAMLTVAFFSSKRWHWGHVTIVAFIFVFASLYLVLAAETLRVHGYYRSKLNQELATQQRLEQQNQELQYGTPDTPGIVELQSRLQAILRVQGRVWQLAAPDGEMNPENGSVSVRLMPMVQVVDVDAAAGIDAEGGQPPPPPDPATLTAGIENGSVLFAFQRASEAPNGNEPDRGPQYLGEFQVTEINGNRITFTPVLWNSWDAERTHQNQRLAKAMKSPIPWVLYETMPTDDHDSLRLAREGSSGGFPLAVLQQAIPQESLEEYRRDGEQLQANQDDVPRQAYNPAGEPLTDDQVRELESGGGEVVWRYERPLRDYELLFQSYARRRVELISEIAAFKADIARLQAAKQTADERINYRSRQITLLNEDLNGFRRETQAVKAYAAKIERQLQLAETMLTQTLEEHRQLAAELAEYQLSIVERLDAAAGGL